MEIPHAHIELDGKYLLTLDNHHLKPGYTAPCMHTHHWLEISYIKAGRGVYRVENRSYDIKKGDVFVFNNIEAHAITVDPEEELVNMVIHFEPRFIWSIESNLFDSRYLKIFFDRNENFQNRLDRNNPASRTIGRLFLEIEEEFIKKQPEYELMIKVKLLNILVALIRHYGYTGKSPRSSYGSKIDLSYINRAMDYIDTHLEENIRLEDLAKIACMNPSYFSTLFKKYNGISPSEYIARKRVFRAIEYLRASDKTVLEIASLCGFNSTAAFNKTFKKITGKVPSDFR